MSQKTYEQWLNSLQPNIRTIALAFPGDRPYRMKEGAPYHISCAGTTVWVHSYTEEGAVNVVVLAKDKWESAIAHERMLIAHYGTENYKPEESNVLVTVDPQWLEELVEVK